MPSPRLPDRLMPLAASAGVRPWYGDIHNHCALSYGHGTLDGALTNARRQLDFVSVTGHAYWPDMPVDEPSVAHIVKFHVEGFARLAQLWPGHFKTLAAYHDPGHFTVFPGYEMHSSTHGDYTIVLRDIAGQEMIQRDTPEGLLTALRAAHGAGAMAFPHHIAYRTGARGVNWQTFRPELSPVVELISMHGASESSLTDRPFLHSMGPGDGLNTVHAGWNDGLIFGVIGNTDHHSGYPGSYGHGRGVVYAPENTSQAIWDGLQARHTAALTGDTAHLFALANGAMPGDILAPAESVTLDVEAVAGGAIDYIDVLRNGRIEQRITPVLAPAALSPEGGTIETLLTVEFGWGARGSSHHWTGWLSVEDGEVLGVEPRLRGPEIVSPLEGDDTATEAESIELEDGTIRFSMTARANPNNATPAMQGFCARVRIRPDAIIHGNLGGKEIALPASRLMRGAYSDNLGPIDTPAFRIHPMPRPEEWQWHGRLQLGPLDRGDWLALRMRQQNGQWAWGSAFFCR